MDNRSQVREFLTTRRANLTPQQAGILAGGNRRVTGLRRGEVAMLADVSVEYYSRLERGDLSGVSDQVLDALARALQLDEAERSHLFDLARAANNAPQSRPRRRGTGPWVARPTLQAALEAVTDGPAFVRNGRMDVLAANRLGWAFCSDVLAGSDRPWNLARFAFLDLQRAERFYPDWSLAADTCVAILRTEAGRDPHNKSLHDLIGELSTRSEAFRTRWGAHNVRHHGAGTKNFHHAAVGELTLAYEAMELVAEPGLSFLIYTAEPASPSAERLQLLASWAASQDWPDHPALTPERTPTH